MKNVFGFFLVILCTVTFAQEKLGIVNSNYHPVSSVHWNASSTVDSRTYMQLNLVGVNAFLFSNAAYVPNFSYWSAIKGNVSDPVPVETKQRKFVSANVVLDGPAFTMSKRNYGFGFFVRARSVLDIRRLPYQLLNLITGTAPEDQTSGAINMKNARLSNMSWAEYGGNFGVVLLKRKKDMLSGGFNIKYLTGINLQFINFEHVQGTYSPAGYNIDEISGKYRSSGPAYGSGKGFSFDLGMNYKKTLSHIDNYYSHSTRSKCQFADYKFKLGVSLRDVGFINFKNSTVRGELGGSGMYVPDDSGNADALKAQFVVSEELGTPIKAVLPAALSVQGDYNFENDFFLNLSINKNVTPNKATGVQSHDFISMTPRYELKNIEVAMPLTLQRFIYPQVGFALRVRSLVVGIDNVFPLFLKKNTYGAGIYFNLAFSIFTNPACGGLGGKIDDCGKYKSQKRRLKHKSTLISDKKIGNKGNKKHKKQMRFD